jgi:uncharacterized protein YecE (DUF72 family)
MDFGKLADISGVDFTLPPDPPFQLQLAEQWKAINASQKLSLYLGCTGYHMRPWVGKWYPEKTPATAYLKEYGKQFNTFEHNTTHYRIPDPETIKRWYADTPPDFRFCSKVPQTISHDPMFGRNNPDIAAFCRSIEGLKEKNGCTFLQLPPHFGADQMYRLEAFFQYWPASMPLAVEVRHESYFPKVVLENLVRLLNKYGAYTVITDVAGRRDVCHMALSGSKVIIRLIGNGMVPTDHVRMEQWLAQFSVWQNIGVQEIYLFCHQPDNLLAPDYCLLAMDMVQKAHANWIVRGPKEITPPFEQLTLF